MEFLNDSTIVADDPAFAFAAFAAADEPNATLLLPNNERVWTCTVRIK